MNANPLYITRLMPRYIAYKAENGLDIRQENGIAKGFSPIWFTKSWIPQSSCMGPSFSDRYASGNLVHSYRSQRLVDGPDEVNGSRQECHPSVQTRRHDSGRRRRIYFRRTVLEISREIIGDVNSTSLSRCPILPNPRVINRY